MVYLGGKHHQSDAYVKVIKQIAKQTGATIYVEPFVGGFNVPTRMAQRGSPFKEHHLSDLMRDTIELHRVVAFQGFWPIPVDEATYKRLREERPDTLETYAAGLLQSFGGKRWGGFVAFDQEHKTKGMLPYFVRRTHSLMRDGRALRDLQGVTLNVCPYDKVIIPDGAIVYCDPPYAGATGYQTGENFDTVAFWAWANALSKRCTVLVSEFTVPNDWDIVHTRARASLITVGKSPRQNEYLVCKGPATETRPPITGHLQGSPQEDHSWLDWLD